MLISSLAYFFLPENDKPKQEEVANKLRAPAKKFPIYYKNRFSRVFGKNAENSAGKITFADIYQQIDRWNQRIVEKIFLQRNILSMTLVVLASLWTANKTSNSRLFIKSRVFSLMKVESYVEETHEWCFIRAQPQREILYHNTGTLRHAPRTLYLNIRNSLGNLHSIQGHCSWGTDLPDCTSTYNMSVAVPTGCQWSSPPKLKKDSWWQSIAKLLLLINSWIKNILLKKQHNWPRNKNVKLYIAMNEFDNSLYVIDYYLIIFTWIWNIYGTVLLSCYHSSDNTLDIATIPSKIEGMQNWAKFIHRILVASNHSETILR